VPVIGGYEVGDLAIEAGQRRGFLALGGQFLYDANPPLLQILQSDQFNWVTILHEYGHSIARQLKIDGAPGGVSHTLGQNLSVPPAISPANKLAGLETAWSEGFADFFAVYVEEFESAYTFHIPGVVDGSIEQYGYDLSLNNVQGVKVSDGVHSSAPVGTVIPINPTGEDNELSVARTLWQFIKQPDIALPATKLFSTLQAAQATTLSAAIPALMQAGNAATFDDANNSSATAVGNANDFACVLSANAVAPLMITPADDTQVDPNPHQVQLEPGRGGSDLPARPVHGSVLERRLGQIGLPVSASVHNFLHTLPPRLADHRDRQRRQRRVGFLAERDREGHQRGGSVQRRGADRALQELRHNPHHQPATRRPGRTHRPRRESLRTLGRSFPRRHDFRRGGSRSMSRHHPDHFGLRAGHRVALLAQYRHRSVETDCSLQSGRSGPTRLYRQFLPGGHCHRVQRCDFGRRHDRGRVGGHRS